MNRLILITTCLLVVNTASVESGGFTRGCYYTNWSQYRPDKAKFRPENYSPGLCSHIFYAFVEMDKNFELKANEWNDISSQKVGKGMYQRFNDLKNLQTNLKTVLSFGGSSFSDTNRQLLKEMVNSPRNRATFVKSSVEFLKTNNFDGLDLAWVYPDPADSKSFNELIKELSSKLHLDNLLFTMAVSASVFQIDALYNVETMKNSVDMVNILTYDMNGSWNNETGFNSPLFDNHGDELSVSDAVKNWEKVGLPKGLINIGLPTYGRGWTLKDKSQNRVGAQGSAAKAGHLTRDPGFLAYYELCNMVNGGKRIFDNRQKVPYLLYEDQWISYDDEESFGYKLKWVKEIGLGGVFAWAMDMDDFNLMCNGNAQQFPMLTKILKDLSN